MNDKEGDHSTMTQKSKKTQTTLWKLLRLLDYMFDESDVLMS